MQKFNKNINLYWPLVTLVTFGLLVYNYIENLQLYATRMTALFKTKLNNMSTSWLRNTLIPIGCRNKPIQIPRMKHVVEAAGLYVKQQAGQEN